MEFYLFIEIKADPWPGAAPIRYRNSPLSTRPFVTLIEAIGYFLGDVVFRFRIMNDCPDKFRGLGQ